MKLYLNSESQAGQESFVLGVLKGLRGGSFLEIGSSHPVESSNTLMLEQQFNWLGIGIDLDSELVSRYNEQRNSVAICADATKLDYKKLFDLYKLDVPIYFLQVDIEPSTQALECLYRIPFDQLRIKVITFEHDAYTGASGEAVREKSRIFLQSQGFALVCGGVKDPARGREFEDWYIHESIAENLQFIKFQARILTLKLRLVVKLKNISKSTRSILKRLIIKR